jgi:hypothetical protein
MGEIHKPRRLFVVDVRKFSFRSGQSHSRDVEAEFRTGLGRHLPNTFKRSRHESSARRVG